MPEPIDTTNKFIIGASALGADVIIGRFPIDHRMTREDALNLAAWLVTLADPTGKRFAEVLRAVQST